MDTGWTTPASVTELSDGDDSWTGPGLASTNNGSYARCELDVENISNTLRFLFDFDLPVGTIVKGIEVRYEAKSDLEGNNGAALTSLVKGGVTSGNDKAEPTFIPEADTVYTRGSSTDMWGLSLTVDDINATNFGFDLKFNGGADAAMVFVDYGQMKIHYVETTFGTSNATLPGMTGKAHYRVN